jgi:hypothetical protein
MKYAEHAHTPFWHTKIINYEKNAKYMYLTPGLPSGGRPGACLHIYGEYVKYAEYGTVLPVTMKYVKYDVCPASNNEICKI